ncbi:MAG: type II toxin-antitoxin system HicB family antitoxin [Isosphaerales bacterium]
MATLTYKGYTGVLEVDLDAGELFGRTLGMRDVITFQGKTVEEARESFEESVDFYLSCCEQEGTQPDRPYSGRFNIRITPEVHRRLVVLAESRGQSLNEVVGAALAVAVRRTTTRIEAPDPTWQEVKAKLEAARPKERLSQNGKRRSGTAKSSGRPRGPTIRHGRK